MPVNLPMFDGDWIGRNSVLAVLTSVPQAGMTYRLVTSDPQQATPPNFPPAAVEYRGPLPGPINVHTVNGHKVAFGLLALNGQPMTWDDNQLLYRTRDGKTCLELFAIEGHDVDELTYELSLGRGMPLLDHGTVAVTYVHYES